LLQFCLFTQIAEAIFRYLPYSGAAAPIAEGYFRYWPLVQARGREFRQLAENPFRYRRCHALTAWNNGKPFPLFQPLGHLLPHRGQKRLKIKGEWSTGMKLLVEGHKLVGGEVIWWVTR
jgi:hypothetical protein